MTYLFRTIPYTNSIYIFGKMTFAQLEQEYPEYVIEVKKYAANNLSQQQLDTALSEGYITQAEYDDTIAYISN